jgi:hypothetical protein
VRALIRPSILAMALSAGLAALTAVHANSLNRLAARSGHASAPVSLSLTVGYQEYFRSSAWVPVRVTARNRTADTISGTIEVPDVSSSGGVQAPPQPYRALYQSSLVLPGGVTKEVTLFIPGSSVVGSVMAELRVDNRIEATASDTPSPFSTASISIGALSSDPANLTWLRYLETGTGTAANLVQLTPATLDPAAAALANFDVIVLADGSVSGLDSGQLSALQQFAHNGGGLVLIGGPGWQETLRPLPEALVPGSLAGTQTLPNLLGLVRLAQARAYGVKAPATVSVLKHPRGTVLAVQRGIPLAVQDQAGLGQIVYLAFDPTLDPVAQWSGARSLLSRLILRAAPAAAGRPGEAHEQQDSSLFLNAFAGPSNIGTELTNVRYAALSSIVLFLVLTAFAILLLGPANFFLLRRLGRPRLLWVTIPVGSFLCLGATLGVADHLKNNIVLINTIGIVTLDGTGPARPAALYMGVFAPVPGSYHLTFAGRALPQFVTQFNYDPWSDSSPTNVPVGLRFQEGSNTDIQLPGMSMWSMRGVALHTTVDVPGRVLDKLHIDRSGDIAGTLRNDTRLTLLRPIVVAGRAVVHLPDMPPGSSISVRVRPDLNLTMTSYQPLWNQVYGQPQFGGPVYVGRGSQVCGSCSGGFTGQYFFSSGPCCSGPSAPPERTLDDRIRNAATQIPDAQTATSLGEVLFAAWTEQPLASIQVNGAPPQRRDLNMVVSPLTVDFGTGPFVLRTGTFGARLVDISPRPRTTRCCAPVGPNPIDVATGGSVTFEFDLPSAARIHFKHLWLNVDAGQASGMRLGRLWDWRAGRWVSLDLSRGSVAIHHPNRFVSSRGALLIKLVNRGETPMYEGPVELGIIDAHRNLQISGDGVAG